MMMARCGCRLRNGSCTGRDRCTLPKHQSPELVTERALEWNSIGLGIDFKLLTVELNQMRVQHCLNR